MKAAQTPEQAIRAQQAGHMNVLVHGEGWALYHAALADRIEALMTDLCSPTRDFTDTQYLRGVIAGLREAQTLPAKVIRGSSPLPPR